MTVKKLKSLLIHQQDIFIIDIREPYEYENGSICKVNIPMAEIMNRISEIPKEKSVIIYCKSGKRSRSLKYMLEKIHNYDNLHHLEGGYKAWEEKMEVA